MKLKNLLKVYRYEHLIVIANEEEENGGVVVDTLTMDDWNNLDSGSKLDILNSKVVKCYDDNGSFIVFVEMGCVDQISKNYDDYIRSIEEKEARKFHEWVVSHL